MFGLEFLFTAALWALPLAALPLVLHLLYRRKSPVVHFPSLRFIKSSLQQSAARRKVQRWLLLAIRMLLLALLIWAVAQPARILASRFFASGGDSLAAVVVDTSWSMQYRQNQVTLLQGADQMVQQLLRNELKDTSVLVLTSGTADAGKVSFRSSADLLSQWTPLKPEASREPLVERVTQALDILRKQPAGQKLLLVVSDFQAREFPRALAQDIDPQIRLAALNLQPDHPRDAGVSSITLSPAQPIAGTRATAEVEVAGAPGDVRPVVLTVTTPDGKELLTRPPMMANIDDSGRARVLFSFGAPADREQLVTAKLQGEDPAAWDDARSVLVELPPQQRVGVVDAADSLTSSRKLVRLALDPNEGRLGNWPLKVADRVQGDENALVALLETMPSEATLTRWRDFANQGGTLVLMLRPGFEVAFAKAPETAKRIIESLLPSRPYADAKLPELLHAVPAGGVREEPSTAGLTQDTKTLELLRASRIVPMTLADSRSTRMLIGAAGPDGRASADRNGLLYLRSVGRGRVFTWSVVPEGVNTNLGTHAFFLPLLVNECLHSAGTFTTNTELGLPLVFDDPKLTGQKELELRTPGNEVFRVPVQIVDGHKAFVFDKASEQGTYRWYRPGESVVRGMTQVMPPGDEAEGLYRPADGVLPSSDHTVVAHSLEELQQKVAQISQPQPKWSMPIAIALVLLCTEGLLSTESGLWTWFRRS